jgi:undecaprenyl pyrophosphate synthase
MEKAKIKQRLSNLIPIADAWALVSMADRINKGQYVKFAEFDQETGNVTLRPNREVIADQLKLDMVNVTAEDYKFGELMSNHFQYIAMDAISGKLSEFDQKIINTITKTEIHSRTDMAYLACMAVRYRREIVKEERAEQLAKLSYSSIHQGTIGEKLELTVRLIAKFAGKAFPGSVVRATDGTNLYFWTSSMTVDMWPDTPEEFPIVGVVKSHGHDFQTNQETRLTRVKIKL